jgi:hypothetical protein
MVLLVGAKLVSEMQSHPRSAGPEELTKSSDTKFFV